MDLGSNAPPESTPAMGRRSFMAWVTYGLGAIAAAVVSIPFIGYLFGARQARLLGCDVW